MKVYHIHGSFSHIRVGGCPKGGRNTAAIEFCSRDIDELIGMIDESPAVLRDYLSNLAITFPLVIPEQQQARKEKPKPLDAADILNAMSLTFLERNAVYKDNYKLVGPTMAALFQDGVQLKTPEDFETWHLFELVIVKLARFAASNLTHIDSPHDGACYLAMLEAILRNRNNEGKTA